MEDQELKGSLLTEQAVMEVAEILNMSPAQARSHIVSFYKKVIDFKREGYTIFAIKQGGRKGIYRIIL
jgi:NADH:ubiquinone oxidoreductase subunit E